MSTIGWNARWVVHLIWHNFVTVCKIWMKNFQPFGKKMQENLRGNFFDSHCIVWNFSCPLTTVIKSIAKRTPYSKSSMSMQTKINTLTMFRPTYAYFRRLIVSHLLSHDLSERGTRSEWNSTAVYTVSVDRHLAVPSVHCTGDHEHLDDVFKRRVRTIWRCGRPDIGGGVDRPTAWLAGQAFPDYSARDWALRVDTHSQSIIYDFVCRRLGYLSVSCTCWYSTEPQTGPDDQLMENKCVPNQQVVCSVAYIVERHAES